MPRDEQNVPNFDKTPKDVAWIEFTKLSENDDVIEMSFKPLEWDLQGLWCTFQLEFANPIFVSLGEFPDQVTIYMQKNYFLE